MIGAHRLARVCESARNDRFAPVPGGSGVVGSRALGRRAREEIVEHDPEFKKMVAEVEGSPPLYRPSKFWDPLNALNQQWLTTFGLERFKRSLSQNYFNWTVVAASDPQFRAVVRRWIRHPSLRPFFSRLKDLDIRGPGDNRRFGPKSQLIYRLFVSMNWELMRFEDHLRLNEHLEALLGGTAAKYFIFDIPPALYVAQWYLTRLFPQLRGFAFRHFDRFDDVRSEVERCDFGFFTPNQLALFPDEYFDAFVSISTLPEMALEQISNYLVTMARLARRGVYLKQWREVANVADGYRWDYQSLVLPAPWTVCLDRPDAVQPLFQERAWTRPGAAAR